MLNETLTEGGDIRDGINLTRKMWNRDFVGEFAAASCSCFASHFFFLLYLFFFIFRSFMLLFFDRINLPNVM